MTGAANYKRLARELEQPCRSRLHAKSDRKTALLSTCAPEWRR